MKAPLNPDAYPVYFKHYKGNALYAFVSPSKMYMIHMVGSNSGNEGVTIDYYKTRKMVLKHYANGVKISQHAFTQFAETIFSAYIDKMTPPEK